MCTYISTDDRILIDTYINQEGLQHPSIRAFQLYKPENLKYIPNI